MNKALAIALTIVGLVTLLILLLVMGFGTFGALSTVF